MIGVVFELWFVAWRGFSTENIMNRERVGKRRPWLIGMVARTKPLRAEEIIAQPKFVQSCKHT